MWKGRKSKQQDSSYLRDVLKVLWIDLGLYEKAAGLTYVALTRVRAISDLRITSTEY